jgi:hypothetical protein
MTPNPIFNTLIDTTSGNTDRPPLIKFIGTQTNKETKKETNKRSTGRLVMLSTTQKVAT